MITSHGRKPKTIPVMWKSLRTYGKTQYPILVTDHLACPLPPFSVGPCRQSIVTRREAFPPKPQHRPKRNAAMF